MKSKLLLASLVVFWSSAAFAQSAVVEGYVFNSYSGVPLENVQIVLSTDGTIESSVARPILTDSNGFYSITVPDREIGNSVQIVAVCPIRRKGEIYNYSSGPAHPLVVAEGLVSRNLYVPMRKSLSVRACERVFRTQ